MADHHAGYILFTVPYSCDLLFVVSPSYEAVNSGREGTLAVLPTALALLSTLMLDWHCKDGVSGVPYDQPGAAMQEIFQWFLKFSSLEEKATVDPNCELNLLPWSPTSSA